ncbi:protein kinase [Candidatus Woesearchaeota archaeon]|nr:protein kinase [Candidatus Woesearchaeota archaeon]
MDQETPLYLRLPAEHDKSRAPLTSDTIVIPLGEADNHVLPPDAREVVVPLPPRREVSLEEIAAHDHFYFLKLHGQIGMGGLAAVYRMHDSLEQGFALKVPLRVTPKTYDHFALEAHLLRGLRRASALVPELVSHGVAADFPYLLMDDLGLDFLQNPHIHHTTEGSVEKVTRVALAVCDTLMALHALGYRHNDVKPANIHYALSGHIHLLDFASATPLDLGLDTQAFSPLYLAPERVTDDFPVNEKVDVFGLGVTLYELLAYHPPFMTVQDPRTIPGLREHVHLVKTGGYMPLCGYSPRLTSLVCAMMAYDPSHRPSLPVVRQVLHETRKEYFDQ